MKRIAKDEERTESTSLRRASAALAIVLALTIALAQGAQAQTLTVLHAFTGGADGATPMAGLTVDRAGNLYGTASSGGAGYGAVYKLSHRGSGWVFTPLYSFQGGNDGATPVAAVVFGPDGSLYGTTEYGGIPGGCLAGTGCGTVFNLKPRPAKASSVFSPWLETVLYRFDLGKGDGISPYGEVVFDGAGNLYGTNQYAGGACDGMNCGGCDICGTVYKLTRSGSGWTYGILHNFRDWDYGAAPQGGLIFDDSGNLYGTTSTGDQCGFGMVYELSSPTWVEQTLHTFCGYLGDGADPSAGLIKDGSGGFYGGTTGARPGWGSAKGSFFQLTQSGGGWIFTVLYDFEEGGGPSAPLTMDAAGNLYGTTFWGGSKGGNCGTYGCGTVFKLTPSAGGWTYTDLYDFTGGSDGMNPYSKVLLDANGNLYGTASAAGQNGYGVVWGITP